MTLAMKREGFRDLVLRAQSGDQEAVDRLLVNLRPDIERLARGYSDRADAADSASDVAQEAWLRVWEKLDQFRGATNDEQTFAMFRTWVQQLVRRVGLNAQRRRKAQVRRPPGARVPLMSEGSGNIGRVQPIAPDRTPSSIARRLEDHTRVLEALQGIADETDRTVVERRFVDGQSLHQISEDLRISYDRVRRRYKTVLQQLERELGDLL